jgi:hypothetical protein
MPRTHIPPQGQHPRFREGNWQFVTASLWTRSGTRQAFEQWRKKRMKQAKLSRKINRG